MILFATNNRLLFGSDVKLNISSIRIIETRSNLESVIRVITMLDMCISNNADASWKNWGVSEHEDDGKTLKALFKHATEEPVSNQYIANTFDCFRKNKKALCIYYRSLYTAVPKQISALLVGKLIEYRWKGSKEFDSEYAIRNSEENMATNALNDELFKVFPNVSTLILTTFRTRGILCESSHFPFSLLKLLSIIKDTAVKHVVISGTWFGEFQSSFVGYNVINPFREAKIKIQLVQREQ